MVSIKEIIWLAGLLEGEGSFYFTNSPAIKIAMTDKDVIERVAKLFKVPVYETKKSQSDYKQVYNTAIYSTKAIEWMMTVYSLMGNRRKERIKEIIDKWRLLKFHGNEEVFSCGHAKVSSNTYWLSDCKVCVKCVKTRSKKRYESQRRKNDSGLH